MPTNLVSLTQDQDNARIMIDVWYNWSKKQIFFLSGWAGTGKTTIIRPILDTLNLDSDEVAIACFTANASQVLADKLVGSDLDIIPITIHQLIYNARSSKGEVRFSKKLKEKLKKYKLIIIDEASMVGRAIYNDLLSYGIKILFIGDIGQLPPVTGSKSDAVVFDKPDALLNQIHRQAEGNLLIMLSKAIRERTIWPPGVYGANKEVTIMTRADFDANIEFKKNCYFHADQIICGYNNSRQAINDNVRSLHQRVERLPVAGDRLISLTNKWGTLVGGNPLVNGTRGIVEQVIAVNHDSITISLRAERGNGKPAILEIAKSEFIGKKADASERFRSSLAFFDFAYGITCHKSQGSEWENVLVINEVLDRETHEKWLYTAITRARRKIILVI